MQQMPLSLVDSLVPSFVRPLDKGMGEAVARRTVFRPSDNGDWGRVAARVALGNCLLHPSGELDKVEMAQHIGAGALLMSGRHLQHGDETQPQRSLEVYSNCSTSPTSFGKFYLLLNGSGVGRSYDDQMMAVNWGLAPCLKQALSFDHPDFPKTDAQFEELARELDVSVVKAMAIAEEWGHNHLDYVVNGDGGSSVEVMDVEDSREGWGWAAERYETMAFEGSLHRTLVLNWTPVRPRNSPIGGMQDRPASGPLSPMRAFWSIDRYVVDSGVPMAKWEQAMRVDHFFSREVQVGGARRAARMATKDWQDPDILDFIAIKSKGGLWTSNNSVMVDAEFWRLLDEGDARVKEIFEAVIDCSWINGEPGFINGDKLEAKGERPVYGDGSDFRSDRFWAKFGVSLLEEVGRRARAARFQHITNPCVAGATPIGTADGEFSARSLLGKPFAVEFDGIQYGCPEGFWSNGVKPVVAVSYTTSDSVFTRSFAIVVTKDHRFERPDGSWVLAGDLKEGDTLASTDPTSDAHVHAIVNVGEEEEVFDCRVPGVHKYPTNGLISHNCGEISLHKMGSYCLIGDVAPLFACPIDINSMIAERAAMYLAGVDGQGALTDKMRDLFAEWDDAFIDTAKHATRALIRTNLMPALYAKEVQRTNRIGVGLTGVHEYAWLRFGLTWKDMLSDSPAARAFWGTVKKASNAVKDESIRYSGVLGVNVPHTCVTMKPSGSVSKLYGLTEGAHLPSMAAYLRWVQFKGRKVDGEWVDCDPLVQQYEAKGYPVRALETQYRGSVIVGFPTVTLIARLGMPEVVTAYEASADDQYEYLRLLEKHWIGETMGNQVSYTMKFIHGKTTREEYAACVARNQRTVRCCSVLPMKPAHEMGYEYLPEEEVSLTELAAIVSRINDPEMTQQLDINTLLCAGGACPL